VLVHPGRHDQLPDWRSADLRCHAGGRRLRAETDVASRPTWRHRFLDPAGDERLPGSAAQLPVERGTDGEMTAAILWAIAAAIAIQAPAQPPLPIKDGQVMPLWSGAAPDARGADDADVPALTVYLPRTMTVPAPAMVVCPGGSYTALASNHEGRQVAAFLNSLGVAAFVLRYRLGPKYHHPVEIGD